MRAVAWIPTFTRQADRLFSEEERKALIDYLAEHPAAGNENPGAGGVRKLRFAAWAGASEAMRMRFRIGNGDAGFPAGQLVCC